MKKMKKTGVILAGLLMLTLLLANVLAITGSIGNARMVLNLQPGEEIEKYILIRNVNQEDLSINLTVSGDLEEYVTLKENNFEIKAGEEKKVYFTIVSPNPGTTETKINIVFIPKEGNGVGLSSTIIVVAEGEATEKNTSKGILNWLIRGKNNSSNETVENNNSISGASVSIGSIEIGLLSTTIILAIFIILLVIYSKKVKNKKERETKPKKNVKNIE